MTEKGNFQSTEMHWEGAGTGPEEHLRSERNTSPGQAATEPPLHASNIGGASTIHETSARLQIPVIVQGEPSGYGYGYPHPGNHSQQWFYRPALEFYLEYAQQQQSQLHQMQQFQWQGTDAEGTRTVGSNSPIPTQNPGIYGYPYASYPRVESQPQPQRNQMQHYSVPVVDVEACFDEMAQAIDINKADAHVDTQQQIGGDKVSSGNQPALEAAVAACLNKTEPFRTDSGVLASGTEMEGAPKQASSPQSMILPAQSEGSKYLQNVLSVGAAAKGVRTCGHGDARLISSCLTQEICVDLAQSEQQIQTDPLLLQFASKEASKASSIRTSVHHELPPDFQQAESGVVTDCGAGEYTHSKHSERSENESEDQMKVSITEASALHHFPTTSIEYLKQTSFASRRQQEAIILRTENQQQSTLVQRDASERTVQSPSTLLMNGNQETSTTEISSVYTASPGHLQCNRQIPVSVAENQQHQTRFTPFSICSKPPSLNGKSHFQSSISLTESQLPHSSAASLNKSQQEWIDSIVGRDWEVFWKQGSSRTTLKYDPCVETAFAQAFSTVHESSAFVDADDMPLNMLVQQRKDNTDDDVSDNSADADHEEDWYDATVHMFDRPGESEGSATLSLHFRVSFVGDDEIYFMILTPETVRPSARGWIRRARAVLRQPLADAKDHDQKCWEDSLPPDTRTMADRVALESIQKDVLETFPVTKYASFYSSDGDANAAFQKLWREHATCCHLMQLIRSQIFLRSRLTYIDSQDTNESSLDIDKDDDSDPTEPYIDFLNKCLQELDQSCQWHFRCWGLLYRLFAVRRQYQLHVSISRDFLLNQCLSNGRINLATILANKDTSPKASRSALKGRKRCASVASSPQDVLSSPSRPLSARRRAKRRRKSYGFSDHWLVSSGIQSKSDETEEEEDLLTTDIIKIFVETVCHADKRWYTQHFGNMLLSISSMVMTPYVKWERSAQFFLGERDTLDEGTSDGETTAEDSDEDDNDDGHVIAQGDHMRAGGRRYVRYEEIESLLESANHGRLLQCFDLTDYVTKLCNKLAAIDSFETRAWDLIASVLDETAKDVEHAATFLWDKDNDSTQKGLQALLQEALRKGGPIENMYSIGRVSSPLSREVIENAMVYRAWFLDLKYAESVRERVAFVDGVVSRLSKLPPLPSKSGSLDQFMNVVALRVRALAAKYLDCVAIFNRYQTMLTERVLPKNSSDRKGLLSLEGARETLHELQQLPVISSAEEMVAIRNDVLDWEANARSILLKWKPAFCEVSDLKKAVDRILDGTSKTREDTKRGKKYSSAVEAEMKAFAHADVHNLCGPLYSQTITLFAASAAWKDRADSVLNVLRAFGDGGKLAIGFQKPTCMVDLKRIEDLMSEYPGLEVDLPETFDRLCKIRATALKWSSLVSAYLLDDSLSFDDSLSLVERMGLERPPGIIVDPSRQVLDLLGDLLRWYGTLKDFVSTSSRDNEFRHTLLVTGLQVVERFTRKQKTSDQFDVPDNAMELLMASSVHRKSTRTLIIVSKLDASPLSRAVLERMTDKSRDDREGSPLFFLRLLLWAYFVDDFVARCIDPEASRSHTTLTVATVLQKARPYKCGVLSSNDMENVSLSDLRIAEFNHLVSKGEEREQEAREAICNSKYLLRECRMGAVESHLVRLKDLSMDFKSRASSSGNVILDFRLEQHLEQDVKLFGWLVRTFPYPVLQSDNVEQADYGSGQVEDKRVPWDVLVSLHDRMPSSDLLLGDFACIILRVKELYVAANKWQQDISRLTMLSLRGVKRRTQKSSSPAKAGVENPDDADAASKIGVDEVVELSNSPILLKVVMPREKGIRGMLENTLKFEVQLHEFLDVDYGGLCDRVAIPDEGSLVGYDGTFLLYRLAESPLFDALRSSIKSISEVASNVLANTRGKAAFDWIRQVFDWMDAMRANVTITDSRIGAYQLSIPFAEAKNLLRLGDQIFLDLSEELRKTLSNHKIHVAKDKDGKLIVKSKKGDAHHSLGSTCIRWCPFLYDALTFNVLQFEHWESRVSKLSKDFLLIRQYAEAKAPNHPIVLHRYYGCREELTQLLEEGTDLVVSPAETLIESCRALFTSVDSHLRSHSNFEAAKLFAESRYSSDTVVIENSQVLLDSLVERTRLTCGFANTSLDEISKEGPFRRAGRAAFVIALQNAVRTLHIADPSGASYSFCAIKAWEIENALFDLYQRDLGECQISSEYRDKARVLRRSLEDSENLHLAVSVLCERICCDDLVQMTVEQLANPTVKKDREKAAEAARQNLVLTGSSATTKISSLEKSQHNNEVGGTNLPAEGPVTQVQLLRPQKPMVQLQIRKLNSPLHKTSTAISTTSVEFPPSMSPISSTRTTSKFGDLIKAARARGPPPPPPSLVAMSLKPVAREHLSSSNNGEAATTLSGGNIFSLSLAEGTRTFSATLHAEGDSKVNAHGLLPGVLKETGRLKADDFTYFIRGKLDGGRWEAVAFRLATVSDKDAKEHKKFYKEYEGKKRRIAMFSLGDGKAFLVTPKYHRLAKALTFARSTSTYIIVLTKKE